MMTSPEQFIEAQKKQLTAFVGLGQKSFANMEKAVELNMNMAKGMLDQSAEAMNSILSVKDVQELMAVSSTAGQPMAEKAVDYSKEVYGLSSSIMAEASKMFEDKMAENNKAFVEMFESASKNAPAGSESTVALIKSAISAANSAYDTVSKAAKQAVEMAETNVTNATNSAVKASKAASKKAAA